MRKYLFFILTLLTAGSSFAQTEVVRKDKINGDVVEEYKTVITADKQLKQGQFRALYKKRVALAVGNYADDKKVGMWRYFDKQQKLLQIYNYDKIGLQYEAQEDSISIFKYVIDQNITDTTRATRPVKIGGRYYGYLPYLRFFKLPDDLRGMDPNSADVVLELLISPLGRLADLKIHFSSPYGKQVFSIDADKFTTEDRSFIPATVNGNQVSCTIFLRCFLKSNGELDM